MSRQCTNCGLISPEEAVRCDCGYDFTTRTIESSYLLAHIQRKHGDDATIAQRSALNNIRSGQTIVIVAMLMALLSYAVSGRVSIAGGALVAGLLLLSKGRRQRRELTLDDASRTDLMRRS